MSEEEVCLECSLSYFSLSLYCTLQFCDLYLLNQHTQLFSTSKQWTHESLEFALTEWMLRCVCVCACGCPRLCICVFFACGLHVRVC